MQKRTQQKHTKENQERSSIIALLTGFLCALLLSRVYLHGAHAPLAPGLLLAASLTGAEVGGIAGGIVVGSFLGETSMWQELVHTVLYWTALTVMKRFKREGSPLERFLMFALIGLISLPLGLLSGVKEALFGVISFAVALLSAFEFRIILRTVRTARADRVLTDTEQTAVALGVGCLLLSVSDLSAFGWSLSVMLAVLLTATAVTVRGALGAAAGIFWSVMLTLYAKADPMLIGSVAVASLFASLLRTRGRPFVAVSFVLSGILFETYAAASDLSMNAQNMVSGLLFYFLIPRQWIERLSRMTDAAKRTEQAQSEAISEIERHASEELDRMGRLLHGFSGMFDAALPQEDTLRHWTLEGALTICRGCEVRRICWEDAEKMQQAILLLAEESDGGKRVEPIEPIDPACKHFGDLCGAVLLSRRQALARDSLYERAKEQSDLAERQLIGAGNALCVRAKRIRSREREDAMRIRRIRERLTEADADVKAADWYESDGNTTLTLALKRPLRLSREQVRRETERACGMPLRLLYANVGRNAVNFVFEQSTPYLASMRVSKTQRTGAVSGDATGECRLSGGRVCFALSDGMGSGKEARKESEAAIELLFRLYRAGMQKELIYDSVNRLLMAQNEQEMYATLDAVSIDLNTGEAELLKYGAPPSYLLRGNRIRTISGEALPCGILAEAKPSVVRMQLEPEDRLVLCSDGVQDVLPDGAEQTLIRLNRADSPMEELLVRLAERSGGTDDMTVMVIRVA